MKRLQWHDYITINIYWLGLTTISQSNGLIIPLLVQKFVGPEQQGAAFGRLRLYTLMVALLVQALMGMLSDRSTLRWGRRRPFILVGTLLNMACMIAIGASPSYWLLFGAVVLSQIASNIAHGAEQGLIPDLVPEDRRGRFSGVKSIMELLPVIVVALTVGPLIKAGQMWAAILVAISILFLSMAITMFVHEEPLRESPGRLDWEPFGRLVAMTVVFTIVILGLGELVKGISKLLHNIDSVPTLLIIMGSLGALAMAAAVVIGVWASVRISIGAQNVRQYPSFPWWVINRLAFFVGTTNLSGFAVYFLQARLGLKGEAAAGPASQMMMVVGILILLFALPSGWLADRIGRKRMVALSGLAATLGTLVLVLAPNMTMIYVGGCIIGAATGAFFTTNWALGTDVVPKEEAGRYLGISNLAGAGAGAVGSYIGGPIADYFTVRVPQTPGLGYLLIFAIYAALFLLSTIVLLWVRETWTAHSINKEP
jgi:MFS family permease